MRRRIVELLLIAGVLTALAVTPRAVAMPPHPDVEQRIIEGKIPLPYALAQRGELVAHGVDSPAERPGAGNLHKPDRIASVNNVLCVLVEFSDKASQVSATDFDTLMFTNQLGSVRHYYNEVSYNNYDIVTVNLPSSIDWVTAPQTYAYYCNGENGLGYSSYPKNCQKLAEDIVNLIDPIVNFASYDNDADGFVDGIVLVHTGPGAEYQGGDTALIWSHKWNTKNPMWRDGKYVFEYSIQPEYWQLAGDMTAGVFCHELGHLLFGLPDLYDADYSSRGVGKWTVMAVGSWNGPGNMGGSPAHLDAWCRIYCGFTAATNVTGNVTGQSIPDVEENSSGAIFRLWTNGAPGSQYFLIENRRKWGYDYYIPAAGLLIWHIDESVITENDNEWYPGYTTYGHYIIALEQSDNLYEMEMSIDNGDNGDPFPGVTGKTSFTNLTAPSSADYDGTNTLVAVTNISAAGAVMTADMAISLVADVDDYSHDDVIPREFALQQNYPNPFNPRTRIVFALPKSSFVTLSVYNALGEKIEGLIEGYLPAGAHAIDWVSQDGSGHSLPSGVYFYWLVTDDVSLSRKMLLLK